MKIMIVDDSAMMRGMMKKALERWGTHDVSVAENGARALELLAIDRPDLILLDWNMPKLDGFETLKQIRESPDTAHILVIMVTAQADKTKIVSAIQAGVSNYLVKPVSEAALIEKIQETLRKANRVASS
mgnify:CR=1 FL=1